MPLVVFRVWFSLPTEVLARVPYVFLFVLALLLTVWSLAFPLTTASQRSSAWTWRPPELRRVLLEAVWALPLTIAGLALTAGLSYALYWIGGEEFATADAFQSVRQATELPLLYLMVLIWACTLGPVSEEVFTRGFLQNALKRWLPSVVALVIQAAIFAVLHPQPMANMVVIFFLGVYLGTIYDWRKTLVAPIFVHMGFNTVVVSAVLITVSINREGPVLGISGVDRPKEHGCTVSVVAPGSAAEDAGLRVGDHVVGIDGEGVANFLHLVDMIRARAAGQEITVQFYRDEVLLETRAVLRKRE